MIKMFIAHVGGWTFNLHSFRYCHLLGSVHPTTYTLEIIFLILSGEYVAFLFLMEVWLACFLFCNTLIVT